MRWVLALWLAIGPACAQEAIVGSGVYGGTKKTAYTGPGDIVSGASAWWGVRAYTAAIAAAATQKLINVRNTGTNETCDILVATSGGFAATVTNCSGASSGTAVATFCTGGCAIPKAYDQSGNGFDEAQATAATQPTLTISCIGTKPCMVFNGSQGTATAGGGPNPSQPFSLSAVAERTGGLTSFSAVIDNFNGSAGLNWGWANSNNTYRLALTLGPTATASDNAFHALQSAVNGASSDINVDGTRTGSLNPGTGSMGAGNTDLGTRNDGTTRLTGDIAEAGAWPSGFTSGNETSICQNQQAYYGAGNFGATC